MNRDDFAAWLNGFITAWENNDIDQWMDLYTEHNRFWESPFEVTLIGAAEHREDFTKVTPKQLDRHMDAEILGVGEESGVACWRATYRNADTGVLKDNYGVMLVRFSTNGKCHEIIEWQCIRDHPE